MFQEQHSQDTWIALMADTITRLIAENFEHYIPEATRSTTAGQKKQDQNLTWKSTCPWTTPHAWLWTYETSETLCIKDAPMSSPTATNSMDQEINA